jgi:hypothetical protein
MGIYIWINSRDCQVNDWKRGNLPNNPPHKAICGKPTSTIPAVQPPSPLSDATSGAQATAFHPSPALLRQMSLLEENPTLDYVLVQPEPLPDHGIVFQSSMGSLFFRVVRDQAFETGDSRMVATMYSQLSKSAKAQVGYGIERLENQLKLEFGVDVKAEQVTSEES